MLCKEVTLHFALDMVVRSSDRNRLVALPANGPLRYLGRPLFTARAVLWILSTERTTVVLVLDPNWGSPRAAHLRCLHTAAVVQTNTATSFTLHHFHLFNGIFNVLDLFHTRWEDGTCSNQDRCPWTYPHVAWFGICCRLKVIKRTFTKNSEIYSKPVHTCRELLWCRIMSVTFFCWNPKCPIPLDASMPINRIISISIR